MDGVGSVKTVLINENKTLFIMELITSFVKQKIHRRINANLERRDVQILQVLRYTDFLLAVACKMIWAEKSKKYF